MHILGVKTKIETQEIIIFQITKPIKYASLEYRLYKSWNIKVDYKIDILNKIINFLKTKNIFDKNWIRDNNVCMSILSMKNHVNNQINLINNRDKKE